MPLKLESSSTVLCPDVNNVGVRASSLMNVFEKPAAARILNGQ